MKLSKRLFSAQLSVKISATANCFFSFLHVRCTTCNWSWMHQFAKYMNVSRSIRCCMTMLSTFVVLNQLLGHIYPEIQQPILTGCSDENFKSIDEADFHHIEFNKIVILLQTESQTNEMQMVNMIKIPTLHFRALQCC